MVLADLDEIICTSICEEVHPFLRVPCRRGEVLNKVIINDVGTVGAFVIFVCLSLGVGTLIQVPPVPKQSSSAMMLALVAGLTDHSA